MSTNITWHSGLSHEERVSLVGQKGLTIWFTGLSASGKSTIAAALEKALLHRNVHSYRLDGDNIRFGLNKDLGFSQQDRSENIRRISEVAKLFADSSSVAITAFISPYRSDRDQARELHTEAKLPFIEIFVDVPLSVAEKRDPKGLYAKAKTGEIKQFTGISAPYEEPFSPEIHLENGEGTVESKVQIILDYLEDNHFLRV